MKAAAKVCSLAWLALAVLPAAAQEGQNPARSTQSGTNASAVELKGKIGVSKQPGGLVQFKTERGAVYTLISNRNSAALFADTNLQAKTLILKGRLVDAHSFEVTGNLGSIRDGKIHELYYYCDICSIKGSETGPCMCCREPVHLIEEPVGSHDH